MSKLEVALLVGAESKAFLASLTQQLDRMEKLTTGKKAAASIDDEDDAPTETVDDDEDFAPPKKAAKGKKAAPAFDDDEETTAAAVEAAEDDDEDFTAPPKKAAKPKKITIDQVNDACKARAMETGGKEGRAEVLAILKKKFKTTSVAELKPEQYPAVIAAMEV